MKRIGCLLMFVLFAVAVNICAASENLPILTLMTHDSFAVSDDLLAGFEQSNGVRLKILKAGDAGAALNQAILSKKNPMADVFFGVDNTFMSRALAADIFEPYASPKLSQLPDSLRLDSKNRLLPVDFGDVCLNYDKQWFSQKGLAPPRGLNDLIQPAYKGLTVVQHPATSSPGLAFLLTTIGLYGTDGYLDFWKKMRENDVSVATGWSDAYYGQFTRAKGGTRPIVVSYATSPAAEVFYSEEKPEESPTAAVLGSHAAFRQVEFVGVLKGARQPALARKLVDFILGDAFQAEIPLHMWVFPAVSATPLPPVFKRHGRQAFEPVMLSPEAIEAGREKWIDAWTDTVLR
jgi:thiamine transport system substrate-binding protein